MISHLTILLPTYNDSARALAAELCRQASAIGGLSYEVYIVDDGSTDERIRRENMLVSELPCCHYAQEEHHDCRSAMRNAMARYGQYEWCLMIDARLTPCDDQFLKRYLESGAEEGGVVIGGVTVDGGMEEPCLVKENLRFRYERHEQRNHSLEARRRNPYRSMRTTNFFFHRSVLQRVPYDERVKGYGYEDVLLGKALSEAGIPVLHIDNPVVYTSFEDNEKYLQKVREALQTLKQFEGELTDYSPLLSLNANLSRLGLSPMVRLFHSLFGKMERKNLIGKRPNLLVFKLYKLGLYAMQ